MNNILYQGVILFLQNDNKENNLAKQGLYKVYLLPPENKIVNGIPLSNIATHSTNYYRYSNIIYRPGDKVYLLKIGDKESNYYLILGSPSNIYIPEYNINRVNLYDSITGNGIIISEPELTALNFTSGIMIRNDNIFKLISDIYLTTEPKKQEIEIKNIDLINGNIPNISAIANLEDKQILVAYKQLIEKNKNDINSFKFIAPKDLIKTHFIDVQLFLRPESRLLNFPYNKYRIGEDIDNNKDNHLLTLYNIPHYKLNMEFLNDYGFKSNNTIIYFNNEDNESLKLIDTNFVSDKYTKADKIIYTEDTISNKDNISIIKSFRKINFKENAFINNQKPLINKTEIYQFKSNSFEINNITKLDLPNKAYEQIQRNKISDNNLLFEQRLSEINLNLDNTNNNYKTVIPNTTLYEQKPDYIVLRHDNNQNNNLIAELIRILYNNINLIVNENDNIKSSINIQKNSITSESINNNNKSQIYQTDNLIQAIINSNVGLIIDTNKIVLGFKNGASINIEPDKITLKVGNTGLNITADSITQIMSNNPVFTTTASGAKLQGNYQLNGSISVSGTIGASGIAAPPISSGPSISIGSGDSNLLNHNNNIALQNLMDQVLIEHLKTKPIIKNENNENYITPEINEINKTEVKDKINNIINDLLNEVKNLLASADDLLCKMLKLLSLITVSIACLLAYLINKLMDYALQILMNIINDIINKIKEVLSNIVNSILDRLNNEMNGFLNNLMQNINEFINAINNMINNLIQIINNVINTILNVLNNIVNLITDLLQDIISFLDNLINYFLNCLTPPINLDGLNCDNIDFGANINVYDNNYDVSNFANTTFLENNKDSETINLKNNINTIIQKAQTEIDKNNRLVGININNLNNAKLQFNNLIETNFNILNNTATLIQNNLFDYIKNKDDNLYNYVTNVNQDKYNEALNVFNMTIDTLINNNLNTIINDIFNNIKYSC